MTKVPTNFKIEDIAANGGIIRDLIKYSKNETVQRIILYIGFVYYKQKRRSFTLKQLRATLYIDRLKSYRILDRLEDFGLIEKTKAPRGNDNSFKPNNYLITNLELLEEIYVTLQKGRGWVK